jgi:hypothetical protein
MGSCRGWCAARCPGWCAARCPGWCAARCPGWCAARCPGVRGNRRGRAVSRAPRVARTGPAEGRPGRASRRASHHVTGPPAGFRSAHPWQTPTGNPRPARSRRSGSSRFRARSPLAVAVPVPPAAWGQSPSVASGGNPPAASAPNPPGAWGRSPPGAWAGNGAASARSRIRRAPGRTACGQTQPGASAQARDGDPGADRVAHLADPGGRWGAGPTAGHRRTVAACAVDRSRSGLATAGHRANRAAPASHLMAAANPPVGRSAGRRASAVDHPARRPVDHALPAAGQPGRAGAAGGQPGWAGAAAGRPAGHPAGFRPGTAAGRSTGHPAIPRPGAALGRSRNRNRRAAPARDPDTGCWRAHGAEASRGGASHRSACCALSPGQREITTSCGTQVSARRHSCPPVTFG